MRSQWNRVVGTILMSTLQTIIVYSIEKISLNYSYLLPDLAQWLTLSGSNYPYLEQISLLPLQTKADTCEKNSHHENTPI